MYAHINICYMPIQHPSNYLIIYQSIYLSIFKSVRVWLFSFLLVHFCWIRVFWIFLALILHQLLISVWKTLEFIWILESPILRLNVHFTCISKYALSRWDFPKTTIVQVDAQGKHNLLIHGFWTQCYVLLISPSGCLFSWW